jgi:hypothetical protein
MLFGSYAFPIPPKPMPKSALQNQSVEVSRRCLEFRTNVTISGNFFSAIATRHPVLKEQNDSIRTKLNGDWQAMPELHRHSFQAQ